MSQSENWLIDDESDSQAPGSPSSQSGESETATLAPRSRLRPAGKAPAAFLPSTDQVSDASDENDQTIPYNVEWKLSINNRKRGGCSELGVVTSLRTFWRDVLEAKLAKAVKKTKKPCEPTRTEVVLSTTHHGTPPITLSFEELEIDWAATDRQRKEWNTLPNTRKKRNMVTILLTFHYAVDATGKNPSARATAEQLHNIRARYGDGTSMTRSVAVGKAYSLMRCPGLPCKMATIAGYHMCAGRPLNGHHDVPDTFRRLVLADERERNEREEKKRKRQQDSRKRKRPDSDDETTNHLAQARLSGGRSQTPEVVWPTTPLIGFREPRRDVLRAYDMFQISQVPQEEKDSYRLIQKLNEERKYDLDIIASNRQRVFQYYLDNEVPEGHAWHYVGDILAFYKQRKEEHAKTAS